FLVAGAGSWGTAFAHVLLERDHDVVLACRTAEQARAIEETGRNTRYLQQVDLRRVEAVALDDAPGDVDIAVVAVPRTSSADVVGVELCAAAKNVIALAAGGVDGLDLGDNSKAALITRGLAEMARLGEAAGARPETFAGLAGMGDLIVTCWSRHGRNRHAGELIAQGSTPDEAVAAIGQTVEGITTAPALLELSHRLNVELPITEGVCAV